MQFQLDPLLSLAIVLAAGVMGGMAARKVHLPGVTGQILVGVFLGHSGLALFDEITVASFLPLTYFALGLIAVNIGGHLQIRRLRHAAKRLIILLLAEAFIIPTLVFFTLYFLGNLQWTVALLLATLSIATAPATIVAVVKETRSKGVFVKTLIGAVALSNMACISLFEFAHTAARLQLGGGEAVTPLALAIAPLRQLLSTAALGSACGITLSFLTRSIVHPDRLATASFIAILFTAGLSHLFNMSSLLSCMFLGITLTNLVPEKENVIDEAFSNFEGAILAVFFTLAGMDLNFSYFLPALIPVLLMFSSRLLGKLIAAKIAMRISGATRRLKRYLGPALIPQAGVTIGLIILVQQDPGLASIKDLILAIGLTVVTINEIVGPIWTRIALVRSGDFRKDRPRLIDFIHEENIITDFEAYSKEGAIEQLTDLLIHTNHLSVNREALLKSILEHEAEMPTFIGGGLAVPHGIIPEGKKLVGVMGISKKGLPFATPDGIPVHCMVLVATPPAMRDRYLEIFAALARAIVFDRNIQMQLFNSTSPAHAYELLHAEEAEGFNYFLEEETTG